ncbi:Beta-glucosidase 42 [Frankliniella fusca]|uniref:beta-glucosidase n=1 Tax=Frankliniella fusca TaxID=407009 RepID=A0AAE1LJN6_9NEOP|nr:Beta-glucosidase 42 [Frankliniella fusca]
MTAVRQLIHSSRRRGPGREALQDFSNNTSAWSRSPLLPPEPTYEEQGSIGLCPAGAERPERLEAPVEQLRAKRNTYSREAGRVLALAVLAVLALLAAPAASFLLLRAAPAATRQDPADDMPLPEDFFIGAGSSSYQIEGAWNLNGKGVSTCDRAYGNRSDGGGNVACDSYHRYKDDIEMLKLMGASHFRFSIAWARLLPTGEANNVNPDGVRYYNELIDSLLAAGIEPVVTLWHVDLPATLEDAFGGFNDEKIVRYFEVYARTAFQHFGDRVKLWTTVNEPHMFCVYGAGKGRMGATRIKPGYSEYLCGHHMLLAHAKAYQVYRQEFYDTQRGRVGLSLDNYFTQPCSRVYDDVEAAERHQVFEVGWFLDPILGGRGDYPPVMRERVGDRLPPFTAEQSAMLQGSLDFIGINSYYGWSACDGVPSGAKDPSYERDLAVIVPEDKDQNLPPGTFTWSPWSIRSTLLWVRDRYKHSLPVLITENGFASDGSDGLRDTGRIAYFSAWLREILGVIRDDKVDVMGLLVWSLLDSYEWGIGYGTKMGIVHVDFDSANLTRTPKDSLYWFKSVIASRSVPYAERPSASAAPPATSASPAALLALALAYATVSNKGGIL